MAGLCECKPYYAQFNGTSCVQGEFRVHSMYQLLLLFVGENVGLKPKSVSDECVMRSVAFIRFDN